jgi:SAM-dependent methyltransferase
MTDDIELINKKNILLPLFNYLHRVNYRYIMKFPLRKYSLKMETAINELAIFSRYVWCRNNIFSISLHPKMYQYFSCDTKIKRLYEIFFLNEPINKKNFIFLKIDWLEQAIAAGIVQKENNDNIRFLYRIVPYRDFLLITSRYDRTNTLFTYLSYDSLFFADFIEDKLKNIHFEGKTALDIGCGIGILTFAARNFCNNVIGIDLNPNAVQMAQLNAELNQVSGCEFINESFDNFEGGRFDLIISNPPFIHYPSSSGGPLDSDGGAPYGLGITLKIIQNIPEMLNNRGRAFILTKTPALKSEEDYLSTELSKILPENFGWRYYYISDSADLLPRTSIADNIEGYHHIIVEIISGNPTQRIKVNHSYLYRKTHLF